ncbi:tetratricopeptide repeat protein [Pseudofrankia sp. DC12]|uniref:tetratricopeptide repeat protein n=1 Tax=Pseudofrankia sp. DC12 TaxID=683315 RepID=UPI0005F800B0|nr:tetratricopeptide repeat protein [Pseudofrankia sp. DC12]
MANGGRPDDEPRWDVFVSYASEDGGWAEWIAWQLEDAGYSVFLRAWDVLPADHWFRLTDDAIRGARLTVAVVSEAYHRSPLRGAEWQAVFVGDGLGQVRPLLPVRITNLPLAGLMAPLDPVDLFELEAPQAINELLDATRGAVAPGRTWPEAAPLPPGARRPAGAAGFPGRAWLRNFPVVEPLSAPYLRADEDDGPLAAMGARRGLVPFQGRDELDALLDWCMHLPTDTSRPRLRIVTGPGGSGKTHLLAELTARLAAAGWYAGFLRDGLSGDSLDWLSTLTGPVAVAGDYAEAARPEDIVAAVRVLELRKGGPTCLILGARAVSGWWTDDLRPALRRAGISTGVVADELPVHHPSAARVFRRARAAFARDAGERNPISGLPEPPIAGGWTTLDLVMFAWLDIHHPGRRPTAKAELYEEILGHEFDYWTRAYEAQFGGRRPPRAVLRAAGAAVTLLAPHPSRLPALLRHADGLADDDRFRSEVVEILTRVLPVDPAGVTIALRPDPVGDHLVVAGYANDPNVLVGWLTEANDQERLHACVAFARAATSGADRTTVAGLARLVVDQVSGLWQQALTVARAQGGPWLDALLALAQRPDSPLPLQLLASDIPPGHTTLRSLALAVADRLVPTSPEGTSASGEPATAERADALRILAVRLADDGRYAEALAAARNAVNDFRQLAAGDLQAHGRGLASALTNLASLLSESNDRTHATVVALEAVALYRSLAETGEAAAKVGLAIALNNLGHHLMEAGDREKAVAAAREAVEMLRELVTLDPALEGTLATALATLSLQLLIAGEHDQALARGWDAVGLLSPLVDVDPAAHIPALTDLLMTLTRVFLETGDRAKAVLAARDAVNLSRQLHTFHPAACRDVLARSLDALANAQLLAGDRTSAVAAAREAVALRRPSAGTESAAEPGLAVALSNLAACLSRAGKRDEAVEAGREAVDINRELSGSNPGAHRDDLATSLSNHAIQLLDAGDKRQALTVAQEAVELLRRTLNPTSSVILGRALSNLGTAAAAKGDRVLALAAARESVEILEGVTAAHPGAYLPNLSDALHNLANRLAEAGDYLEALETGRRAVELRQALARAEPDVFLPEFAGSLTDYASRLSEVGERTEAMSVARDATQIWHQLAARDPDAFLFNLARSLHNLTHRLADAGHPDEAFAAASEAVEHFRRLRESNPAAFEPYLAGSLSAFAQTLSAAGQHPSALEVAGEAVDLRRRQTDTQPGLPTPDLAAALNDLAVALTRADKKPEALPVARETVEIYRTLVADNRTLWLPNLAGSLSNLAPLLVTVSEAEEAQNVARESVNIYREIVKVRPEMFVPVLAGALNNLAYVLRATGDLSEALAAAKEAVQIYRQLAETNSALFLSDLTTSLTNLADALSAQGDVDAAHALFELDPGSPLAEQPAATGYLHAARASWRAGAGDIDGALDDLVVAARRIDDSPASTVVTQGRRLVRTAIGFVLNVDSDLAAPYAERLPAWATLRAREDTIDAIRAWAAVGSWNEREQILAAAAPLLTQPDRRNEVAVLAVINPEHQPIQNLAAMLDEIVADGLDAVLQRYGEAAAFKELLEGWLNAPTWADSRDYLTAHPELTTDPRTHATLVANAAKNPVAAQHLGILNLLANRTTDDVFDIVIDPTVAIDEATDAATIGDAATLSHLRAAAPAIDQAPFSGPFLAGIQALLTGDPSNAVTAITSAISQGTALQRGAATARLRRLRRTRPDQVIDQLITLMESAA